MKKQLLIIAMACIAIGANAQLLYRVSGNGAKGESYIFGTHHIAPLSVLDSIKGFRPALTSVEELYGEIQMPENPNSPELMQLTMQSAAAPADSTLSVLLSPAQLDSLNSVLAAYSGGMLNASQLNAFKPAMVNTQLAMLQASKAFPGFNPMEQLDTRIQQLAAQASIPVNGFETMAQQMEFLMGAPLTEQAEELMETVRSDSESVEKARKMADSYLKGDLKKLEATIFDEDFDPEKPAFKRLFTSRNNAWIARLRELLPEKRVFVAVGAGHLIGDSGLISQLREAGYEVTPVE